MLIDKEMNKNDLKDAAGISAASIAKLGKVANITTDVLLKICEAMDCKLEDIMETIKDSELIKQMNRNTSVELTNMCMIYDNNGNVLVEEKIGKNYHGLIFPGGHMEIDEPIVDSIIRGIYEETGLTISNLKLCGIKDWFKENGGRYIVFYIKPILFPETFAHLLKAIFSGCPSKN